MKNLILLFAIVILFSRCASTAHLPSYGGIGKDHSLFYYHTGKGEPIIIVHGGPGLNHSYFLPYMDRLADSFHLIYYDQKSCGQAEIPNDTSAMRLNSFVDDIEAVRKKFGLKKFHLLAHSWGAVLGVKYAVKYPSHLSSLILMNPTALSFNDVREASRMINNRFDYTDQLTRSMLIESADFKKGNSIAMEKLLKLGFKQNFANKSLIDSLHLSIPEDYSKRNASLKYLYRDLQDYDFYPILHEINVPTLIIEGDQDAGLNAVEKIRKDLPTATYALIQDAGHFPFIEQWAIFQSVLKKFLSALENKR